MISPPLSPPLPPPYPALPDALRRNTHTHTPQRQAGSAQLTLCVCLYWPSGVLGCCLIHSLTVTALLLRLSSSGPQQSGRAYFGVMGDCLIHSYSLIHSYTHSRIFAHCHCPSLIVNRPSAGTSSCSRVQRTTWCSGQPVLTWRQKTSTWTGTRVAQHTAPHVVHAPCTPPHTWFMWLAHSPCGAIANAALARGAASTQQAPCTSFAER